jgi:hypothetical protein
MKLLKSKCVVLEEWFLSISSPVKEINFLEKIFTLAEESLGGVESLKLLGNDGTHRFRKIKERNWNHR